MAQTPEFKATHTFKVSHENAEVLEAYLRKELGFKPEDIKTRETNAKGLEVMLPRSLSKEEYDKVRQNFEDKENERGEKDAKDKPVEE